MDSVLETIQVGGIIALIYNKLIGDFGDLASLDNIVTYVTHLDMHPST